jgi:hypothetical protein
MIAIGPGEMDFAVAELVLCGSGTRQEFRDSRILRMDLPRHDPSDRSHVQRDRDPELDTK